MARKAKSRQDGNNVLIWGATALAVVAILGACVFIALNRQPSPPVATQPPQQMAKTDKRPPVETAPVEEEQDEITAGPAEETLPPAELVEKETGPPELQLDNLAGTLKLALPFMDVRNKLPREHTCFHRNISPAMTWAGAPDETQSFVVFMEKRQPGAKPFVNWILFDIPGSATGLEGARAKVPALAGGIKHASSDHDNVGYNGPCESRGPFNYAIRVFALDTVLEREPGIHKHDLIRAMNGHIIDAAEQEFIHYHRL